MWVLAVVVLSLAVVGLAVQLYRARRRNRAYAERLARKVGHPSRWRAPEVEIGDLDDEWERFSSTA